MSEIRITRITDRKAMRSAGCARKIDIDGKIHGVDQKITAADLDTLVFPQRDYTFTSRVLIKTITVCRLRVCR